MRFWTNCSAAANRSPISTSADYASSWMKPIRPVFNLRLTLSGNLYLTVLNSPERPSYTRLIPAEKHEEVSHKDELREFGSVSTKTIEGAFSLFKRGVVGSYHKLSKDHLDSYLQEFCWRYNRRKLQPWMFDTLLREVATKKPMTYKYLTRQVF
jgi:hypothetical protein